MKLCRKCKKEITYKNRIKYYNYPGIQKICKPCRRKETRDHNRRKYEAIKKNPLW